MEKFKRRVRQHEEAAGWLVGRRARAAARSGGQAEAVGALRRSMREQRPSVTAAPASVVTPVADLASPELDRLRAKIGSADPAVAARGATMLLELVEPESLAQAHQAAFRGMAVAQDRRGLIEQAWEDYRHDRFRSHT